MSIRNFFDERLLRPSELGGSVQRIVFTTYAALVGLALALAFQTQLSSSDVPTYVGYVFQLGIFWVGAIALTFSIIPLLAGAAHARTRWRYLIATPVLCAVLCTLLVTPSSFMPVGSERLLWVYLVPLPFLAGGIVLVAWGKRWETRTALAISALLTVLFFIAVTLATWWTGTLFGQTVFFLVVAIASVALIPALLVVGFDLSEIAAEAGEHVTGVLDAAPRLWRVVQLALPIAGIVAAFLLFKTAGDTRAAGTYDLAIWCVLLVLAAAGVYAIMRHRQGAHKTSHINYLQAIIAAIAVCFAILIATNFTETTPGYATFDDPLPFSLKLPADMTIDQRPAQFNPKDPEAPHFSMTMHGRPPTLTVTGIPRWWNVRWLTPKSINDITGIHSISNMPLHFGKPDTRGWAHAQGIAHNKHGHQFRFFVLRWEDPTFLYRNSATWYLTCGGAAKQAAQVQSMCEGIRRSFSTAHYISDGYRQSRVAMWVTALLLLLAAAALQIFAGAKAGRAHAAPMRFLSWALFLMALRCGAGFLFGGIDDSLENLDIAANLMSALLVVMSFLALIAAVWPGAWARGSDLFQIRRGLDIALFSTLLMAAIFYLYVFAVGTGEHSTAIRGIIVVLVLSWELATAGSTLNPTHEHHMFPRASRVLIFTGYLVLVATCVFVFSGGSMEGRAVTSFDTESYVANGILVLGGALIISRTLQRLTAIALQGSPDAETAAP